MFASLYSVNEKLGFAIGAAIMGYGLAIGGYAATTGGKIIEQGASAILALYVVKTIVPAVLLVMGVVLLCLYRLDEEQLAALRARAGET